MKALILVGLLVVAVSASVLEEQGVKFQEFKLKHSKTYKNQEEETRRFVIFQDNLRSIEEHNVLFEQGLVSYKKGINKFSDLTQQEFESYLNYHSKPIFNTTDYVLTGASVPDSVDWRNQGQVTNVKDQGQCGACWAFSVTGSTEAAYFRKSGNLVSFSEQQLVDCTTSFNAGCEGGYLDETFFYLNFYGAQTEESYPYTAKDGTCQYNESQAITKIDNYVSIKNEYTLLEAVGTIGPVSVTMDASKLSSYSTGIFAEESCSIINLNHAVLVVGYGSENNQNYWIVKNSWATDWGEDGYFRILRGSNECGIAQDDMYPVIY